VKSDFPSVKAGGARPAVLETLLRRAWLPSVFVAACVVFYFAAGGSRRDFSVPVSFYGDSLFMMTIAKSILDHGWWWTNPSLSAPGTYAALAFPSNSNVDGALVWVLGWFVSDPGWAINLTWMAMLALAGCTAAAALRYLGISRWSAWFTGLLYAFTPFALYRQLDHLSLMPYLIPMVGVGALLLAAGQAPESRGIRLFVGAGCVLIGLNYVYYAFFGAAFFVFAAGIGYFTYRRREILTAAGIAVALILTSTTLALAPSLWVWARDGRPTAIARKTPAESEHYGLKIRQLVGPVRESPLPVLRTWSQWETAAAFPLDNENVHSRLGVVGTLGFLGLLGALFVAGRYSGAGAQVLLAGGKLTAAGVMLATIGGFGSVFALLISPEIRAWNRLSQFLAFFALVGAGFACDAGIRFARRKQAVWVGLAAVAGVSAFGLYDQLHAFAPLNQAHPAVSGEYRHVQGVVRKLEAAIPPGSMVLQLPFRPFPADGGIGNLGPYVQFRPYLVSKTLRWSYPPLSNEHARYQARLMGLTNAELLNTAKRDGFTAVLIDRYGYPDQAAALTNEMTQFLAPDAAVVSEARYVALDLRKVNAEALREATRPLPSCGAAPTYFVDRIVAGPASEPVTVAGWAVDETARKTAARVEILVGGERFRANYGVPRPDVAARYGNPAYGMAGFDLVIPGGTLPPGSHRLTVRVLTSDGKCYQEGSPVPFTVTGA
jgi:phosphoglycerol transferase